VDFGLAIFATDESAAPDVVAAIAEERGFESLFFTEHTHVPASRRKPTRSEASCRASTTARSIRSSP
jgi:alkanesulfonate monooxygenase SsuD/methylene tetrahydromethanopterin reductase-like flavin-dependent oxidoreductase (luciferase family)